MPAEKKRLAETFALCNRLRVVTKRRTIRQRIRIYLAEQDMTQGQLAEALGIDQSHLSLIISGHRRPSLDVAVRMEDLIGIPARDFAEVA